MKTVSIIGTGRLGTSLARALANKGFLLRTLADKSLSAARQSRKIVGCGRPVSGWPRAGDDAALIFLCLPDEEIERAAARLAKSRPDWRGKCVFHTSGLYSSDVLRPLRQRGASVASFHPVQSFPSKRTPPGSFKNIYFGLEGDAKALAVAHRIVDRFGGKPLRIKAEDKPLYHAACSMASNLCVSLFDMSCGLLQEIGIKGKTAADILLPLTEGTLQNVKLLGRKTALTGPIAREDIQTVHQHLLALRKFPAALKAYKVLGRQAVGLAGRRKMSAAKIRALKALLEET